MSVFFYGCMTLDGYLADQHHGLDWLSRTGTTEDTGYAAFYETMDITLMGRRTFRVLEQTGDAAAVYPSTKNYVFTHRPLSQPGFTAVNEDPASFVRRLGENRNIWVVGGNTILAPLLEQDLIDCMILQIAPVLLGKGIPLFTQKEGEKRFELAETKQYGPFAELTYRKPETRNPKAKSPKV